jgi:hypothetical protein
MFNFSKGTAVKGQKRLTLLYFIGFFTSGLLTFNLLVSNGTDNLSKFCGFTMTLIFEFSKAICFIESQNQQRHEEGMRKFLFGLWIFTTTLSIIASQAFMINCTNKLENAVQTSSLSLSQMKDQAERTKEQIASKQKLLDESIKAKNNSLSSFASDKTSVANQTIEYNKQIKSLQSQIQSKNSELQNAINKKWAQTQERLRSEIKQLQSTLDKTIAARDNLKAVDSSSTEQAVIDRINTEIDALNTQLNTVDFTKASGGKSSEGYVGLFELVAGILPIPYMWVKFFFMLILTIGFELLICVLYYLSNKALVHLATNPNNSLSIGFHSPAPAPVPVTASANYNKVTNKDTNLVSNLVSDLPSDKETKPVPSPTLERGTYGFVSHGPEMEVKQKNPIGFSTAPSPREIPADMIAYIEYIYNNQDNGYVPGYSRIARENPNVITPNRARVINSDLVRIGITATLGTSTRLVVPTMNEAIEILKS